MSDNLLTQDEINALLGGGGSLPSASSGPTNTSSPVTSGGGSGQWSTEHERPLTDYCVIFNNHMKKVLGLILSRDINIVPGSLYRYKKSEFTQKYSGRETFLVKFPFKSVLNEPNFLLLDKKCGLLIADFMMGNDGSNVPSELDDIYESAIVEAGNQIIGSVVTEVSERFSKIVEFDSPIFKKYIINDDQDIGIGDTILEFSSSLTIDTINKFEYSLLFSVKAGKELSYMMRGLQYNEDEENNSQESKENNQEDSLDSLLGQINVPKKAKEGSLSQNEIENLLGDALLGNQNQGNNQNLQAQPAPQQQIFNQAVPDMNSQQQQLFQQQMAQQQQLQQQQMQQQMMQQLQQQQFQQPPVVQQSYSADQQVMQQMMQQLAQQQQMMQQMMSQWSQATPGTVSPLEFGALTPTKEGVTQANIDLLLDVVLNVTVELGRTRKSIKEVLELGPGTVVELEKLAGESVELLVNGRLIAKGEVVVIDENFGIRITSIVSPKERLESIL